MVQPALISGSTFITVLRLLWVMCAACPQLALALHQRSIADTLLCLLTGSAAHNEVPYYYYYYTSIFCTLLASSFLVIDLSASGAGAAAAAGAVRDHVPDWRADAAPAY